VGWLSGVPLIIDQLELAAQCLSLPLRLLVPSATRIDKVPIAPCLLLLLPFHQRVAPAAVATTAVALGAALIAVLAAPAAMRASAAEA